MVLIQADEKVQPCTFDGHALVTIFQNWLTWQAVFLGTPHKSWGPTILLTTTLLARVSVISCSCQYSSVQIHKVRDSSLGHLFFFFVGFEGAMN